MDITDFVSPSHVIAGLKGGNKKQILAELAKQAASLTLLDERKIYDVLLERERLGSTGVGGGIAIPHGRLPIDSLFGLFAKLGEPIEFQALDEQPVDLVFLLLAPESAGADHLKALARVSRLLRDKVLCEKLRGAERSDAIYALLATGDAAPHAA